MATRGAYGVKLDGIYILSYQHFDSFPEWLGKEICKIIHDVNREQGWELFRKNFSCVKRVYSGDTAPTDVVRKYLGQEKAAEGRVHAEWYNLLKGDDAASLLEAIYRGQVVHFPDAGDFLKDPVCEYGYVINLDDMILEYYTAGRKDDLQGGKTASSDDEDPHCVCRLMTSYPLAAVNDLTFLEMLDAAG